MKAARKKDAIAPDGTKTTMLLACAGTMMHRLFDYIDAEGDNATREGFTQAQAEHYTKFSGNPADMTTTARAVGKSIDHAKRHAKKHGWRLEEAKKSGRLRMVQIGVDMPKTGTYNEDSETQEPTT